MRPAVEDSGDVGAGATHVVGDDIREIGGAGDEGGAHHAPGGTGEDEFCGGSGGFFDAERAAAGLGDP